jgi:hypothetical protein
MSDPSTLGGRLRFTLAYAAAVFGAGFVLGVLRVLVTAPRLGERAAELLEMPVMLLVIAGAAVLLDRRYGAGTTTPQRLASGALALLLVLGAEVATGVALRGTSVRAALVNPDPIAGAAYDLSLLAYAAAPALLRRRARPAGPHR